ncbi:MAG: transglycosylase [Rhizobium sp.]|nr:transglycosylase [Rhizobium sp.]
MIYVSVLQKVVALCLVLAISRGIVPSAAFAEPVVPPKECIFERLAKPGIRRICIRSETYPQDLCRAIERFALENDLPPEFFARLIWRESRFRADAVSYKGAEGIAQFMPGTAKLRGLSNSFDVVAALEASSRYLSELNTQFGNLGFAAAAYNAGEDGLRRFLDKGRLPLETRDYVFAITGNPIETWQDNPPDIAADALDPALPFLDGCIRLAVSRRLGEPILLQSADWAPWGVQLAANFDPGIARRLMRQALARLPEPLSSEPALIVRQRRVKPGMRPKYQARIGRETRQEANALCDSIRKAGVACAVVKN